MERNNPYGIPGVPVDDVDVDFEKSIQGEPLSLKMLQAEFSSLLGLIQQYQERINQGSAKGAHKKAFELVKKKFTELDAELKALDFYSPDLKSKEKTERIQAIHNKLAGFSGFLLTRLQQETPTKGAELTFYQFLNKSLVIINGLIGSARVAIRAIATESDKSLSDVGKRLRERTVSEESAKERLEATRGTLQAAQSVEEQLRETQKELREVKQKLHQAEVQNQQVLQRTTANADADKVTITQLRSEVAGLKVELQSTKTEMLAGQEKMVTAAAGEDVLLNAKAFKAAFQDMGRQLETSRAREKDMSAEFAKLADAFRELQQIAGSALGVRTKEVPALLTESEKTARFAKERKQGEIMKAQAQAQALETRGPGSPHLFTPPAPMARHETEHVPDIAEAAKVVATQLKFVAQEQEVQKGSQKPRSR